MRRLAAVAFAGAVTATAIVGCAVGLGVPGPPPAALIEVRGAIPGPAFVWVGGCWAWESRWVWVRGSWVVPPHGRAAWVPGEWHRYGRGWRWSPGRWR